MTSKLYIVYFRVWPKKTPSSVELKTQKDEVANFVSFHEGRIAGEYADREGKLRGERPELVKAIDHAIRLEATLVIAHLGRLVSNVPVTRMLLEASQGRESQGERGLDFVCLDNHDIHQKTIHVIANMAEAETRRLSDRAKASLAAAKARGVKLGSHDPRVRKANFRKGTFKAIAVAAQKKREGVRAAYAFLIPEIKARRERGDKLPELVEWLNNQGYTTTADKPFTQTAVWRLIERYLGKEYLGSTRKKTTGCKVGINQIGHREAS